MPYLLIAIAIVVVASVLYLILRKHRSTRSSNMPEGQASEVASEAAPVPGKATHPVVDEISSLPEEAKSKLMNAVWYRCENPHCNAIIFLDVHHIVPEAGGGTNKLDNLIVLCTKCHAAAHTGEISAEQLCSWIGAHSPRFKSDLDWPYK